MAKKNKTNPEVKSPDETLDGAKGRFKSVFIIGVKEDGGLESVTDISSFEYAQYLLNRVSFELFILQRNEQNTVKES